MLDYGWLFPHAWLAEQLYQGSASAAGFLNKKSSLNFSLFPTGCLTIFDDDWDPDCFIYIEAGELLSSRRQRVAKCISPVEPRLEMPQSRRDFWFSDLKKKIARMIQWQLSFGNCSEIARVSSHRASSPDCATSSNISEHCVPNLQGCAAQGSDCFSSWLWIISKEAGNQSLNQHRCLKRPEM